MSSLSRVSLLPRDDGGSCHETATLAEAVPQTCRVGRTLGRYPPGLRQNMKLWGPGQRPAYRHGFQDHVGVESPDRGGCPCLPRHHCGPVLRWSTFRICLPGQLGPGRAVPERGRASGPGADPRDPHWGLWRVESWVFASPIGQPINPRTDATEWERLLREAGLGEARLHDAGTPPRRCCWSCASRHRP